MNSKTRQFIVEGKEQITKQTPLISNSIKLRLAREFHRKYGKHDLNCYMECMQKLV